MDEKIIYSKTISVFGDGFYDSNSNKVSTKNEKRKLSSKMKAIFQSMKDIAVPDFTEEVFIDFYSDGFIRADIRYMYDVLEPTTVIGFLFTSFHKRKVKGSKETIYVGTAFPAIQKKYREDKHYRYNRLTMYIKFIWYYLKYIVEAEGQIDGLELDSIERQIKKPSKPLIDLLHIIDNTFKKIKTTNKMEIRINVENPSTFSDICNFNLRSNITIPKGEDLDEFLKMTKEDLRKRTLSKQHTYQAVDERPPHIVKAPFAVNIHDQKVNNLNTGDPYKKFFIINNPEYPDYAFKFIIPVTKRNIINMLIKGWEMKRRQDIINFIDHYINFKWSDPIIATEKKKELEVMSAYLNASEYNLLTDAQMKTPMGILGYKLA